MAAAPAPPAAAAARKTVTFLRHGVASHNFPGVRDPDPDRPGRYTDSPLTDYGRAQAAVVCAAGLAVAAAAGSGGGDGPAWPPELVVVSPLSRCIETALLAFDAGGGGGGGGGDRRTVRAPGVPGHRWWRWRSAGSTAA